VTDVTIDDLVADWCVRRNAVEREIAFAENLEDKPGAAVVPLKTLRQIALELDRLIARYAHG
jgi:hypothetical protein